MDITSFYASLLSVLFVILSIRTIRTRKSLKIDVGDAGNKKMLRIMRVHANFSEYVPFAILMLFLAEKNMLYPAAVHCLGVVLLVGRLSHAYGVSQEEENFKYRILGMAMTFTAILSSAAYLLFSYSLMTR